MVGKGEKKGTKVFIVKNSSSHLIGYIFILILNAVFLSAYCKSKHTTSEKLTTFFPGTINKTLHHYPESLLHALTLYGCIHFHQYVCIAIKETKNFSSFPSLGVHLYFLSVMR